MNILQNTVGKMVRILTAAIVILFGLLYTEQAAAQSTAQVNIIGIPQILPSPFISDFESNVFGGTYQVQVNVLGGGLPSERIRFRVRLTLDGEILVDEESLPVDLEPGMNMLTPFPDNAFFDVSFANVLDKLPGSRIRQAYQSGALPEGNYTLVIEPILAQSGAPAGAPGVANFTVLYPQPPILIAPSDESLLAESMSVPVFSWSPIMGPPGTSFEYEFLLVQLFDDQSVGDALVSNRAHAEATVNNNIFPYTPVNLPLEVGESYAWQITARDVNGQIPVKNDGKSEIYTFTYGDEEDDPDDLDEPPVIVSPVPDFEPITPFIPVTTITGNVRWRFSYTEGSQSNATLNPSDFWEMDDLGLPELAHALDDPNYELNPNLLGGRTAFTNSVKNSVNGGQFSSNTGSVSRNTENVVAPVFGGGKSMGVQAGNFRDEPIAVQNEIADISEMATYYAHEEAQVKLIYKEKDGSEKVVATTETGENGEFTLAVAPSELAGLMQTNESSEGGNIQALNNFNNFNDATNIRQQRERFDNLDIALTNLYVVVEDPYFAYNPETSVTVSTSSAKNYNVGTVRGTALTYRFLPEVTDAENGRAVSDAKVEVFRMSNRYDLDPVLAREGFPLAEEERGTEQRINNLTLTKVAEGEPGRQITRLFPRKKGATDVYHVKISAEGYKPYFTAFAASPQLAEGDVAIINRAYELQKAPPVVEGRVVRRDTRSPMTNVPVVLAPPGSNESGAYVTTTDDEGRFTISDIEPRDSEYTLIIDGPKVATYQEELLLNENGVVMRRDPVLVDPTLVTVAGKVLNDKDTPVNNATVRWAEGGDPVQTDQQGRFVLANTIGTHTLQIKKIGHRDEEVTVTIDDPDAIDYSSLIDDTASNWRVESPKEIGRSAGKWVANLNSIESFQIGETKKNDPGSSGFDAGNIGYTGNLSQSFNFTDSEVQNIVNENNLNMTNNQFGNLAAYLTDLIGEEGSPSEEIMDLGTIIINRAVGKLRLTVTDAGTSNPIEDAEVLVGNDETTGSTDGSGEIYFDEAPGGNVPVKIKGPASTNYVPFSTEITITDNGDVTEANVQLENGARATGTVSAAGNSVEGATVRLEGRDDISVKTDDDGSYTLVGIPVGEWTLKVSKSGFVGASEVATFSEDENKTINFTLQDSGFDIATLLGFEIEVDDLSVDSDTTISGAFVSISSNDLITVDDDLRLPFTNINVYEENGELKPVGGEVQTDASTLSARLFDFLHVNVNSSSGLIVRQRTIPSSVGFVAGKVEVDYESTFTSATGWTWPNAADQFLQLPNVSDLPEGVGEEELVAITSDGSFPFPDINITDFELNFGSASETLDLFGFDVTLTMSESVLKNDGIHLQGDVTLADIPLMDEASITVEQLWIGIDGSIREASLALDPTPEIALANWKMELMSGTLSELGFALGGNLEFTIPGSYPTDISFSDLSISPDQLFGGQFTLPQGGVDLFGIVALETKAGTDISFGKVQNQDVYYVSGGGTISLPKYIDKSLEFPDFMIRTDGKFTASIAANFEADFFGLADMTVTGVEFRNSGTPSIFVDGQFGLRAIPMINAQAGGLTYRRGGSVSFDEIDLDFDLGAIGEVGVGIGLIDEASRKGFSGNGNVNISGTPINAGIDFMYEQVPGGISFGADFQAGIPPIPVGNFTIEEVGGGFGFDTSNNGFRVTVTGAVSAAPGTGSAIALNPLEVTVKSGPVIEGFAALSVMEQNIADASLLIDFPNRLFDVEARVGFDSLEDVNIQVDGASRIVLSGAPNDTYWMVGTRFSAELLGLFDANANILAAWDLNVNAHPEYSEYTNFVSDDFITGGKISGVHLDVSTEFGIRKSDQECVDFAVGKACAYFWNSTQCQLNADFGGGNFGFFLGSNWEGGGSVTLLGTNIGGADIEASGSISGSYMNNVWSANGSASGSVSAYIGDCRVGCQTKFCWPSCGLFDCPVPKGASLCASASIDVDYRSNRGIQVSLDL